ncbi:unnamed protein product [Bursaphelenchus okinawaensis]|uniref:Uncharacterized protein n=1 Tax=Bursaphelenchus okinawaensis TaxID=465554 RepID=A0A811K3S8_9BILA|nr:unnamed protein product [Bursaphelenchus okinawaensis]CAG9090045.1 unnamed protein product [Bursaphelenchus okinawaensis]
MALSVSISDLKNRKRLLTLSTAGPLIADVIADVLSKHGDGIKVRSIISIYGLVNDVRHHLTGGDRIPEKCDSLQIFMNFDQEIQVFVFDQDQSALASFEYPENYPLSKILISVSQRCGLSEERLIHVDFKDKDSFEVCTASTSNPENGTYALTYDITDVDIPPYFDEITELPDCLAKLRLEDCIDEEVCRGKSFMLKKMQNGKELDANEIRQLVMSFRLVLRRFFSHRHAERNELDIFIEHLFGKYTPFDRKSFLTELNDVRHFTQKRDQRLMALKQMIFKGQKESSLSCRKTTVHFINSCNVLRAEAELVLPPGELKCVGDVVWSAAQQVAPFRVDEIRYIDVIRKGLSQKCDIMDEFEQNALYQITIALWKFNVYIFNEKLDQLHQFTFPVDTQISQLLAYIKEQYGYAGQYILKVVTCFGDVYELSAKHIVKGPNSVVVMVHTGKDLISAGYKRNLPEIAKKITLEEVLETAPPNVQDAQRILYRLKRDQNIPLDEKDSKNLCTAIASALHRIIPNRCPRLCETRLFVANLFRGLTIPKKSLYTVITKRGDNLTNIQYASLCVHKLAYKPFEKLAKKIVMNDLRKLSSLASNGELDGYDEHHEADVSDENPENFELSQVSPQKAREEAQAASCHVFNTDFKMLRKLFYDMNQDGVELLEKVSKILKMDSNNCVAMFKFKMESFHAIEPDEPLVDGAPIFMEFYEGTDFLNKKSCVMTKLPKHLANLTVEKLLKDEENDMAKENDDKQVDNEEKDEINAEKRRRNEEILKKLEKVEELTEEEMKFVCKKVAQPLMKYIPKRMAHDKEIMIYLNQVFGEIPKVLENAHLLSQFAAEIGENFKEHKLKRAYYCHRVLKHGMTSVKEKAVFEMAWEDRKKKLAIQAERGEEDPIQEDDGSLEEYAEAGEFKEDFEGLCRPSTSGTGSNVEGDDTERNDADLDAEDDEDGLDFCGTRKSGAYDIRRKGASGTRKNGANDTGEDSEENIKQTSRKVTSKSVRNLIEAFEGMSSDSESRKGVKRVASGAQNQAHLANLNARTMSSTPKRRRSDRPNHLKRPASSNNAKTTISARKENKENEVVLNKVNVLIYNEDLQQEGVLEIEEDVNLEIVLDMVLKHFEGRKKEHILSVKQVINGELMEIKMNCDYVKEEVLFVQLFQGNYPLSGAAELGNVPDCIKHMSIQDFYPSFGKEADDIHKNLLEAKALTANQIANIVIVVGRLLNKLILTRQSTMFERGIVLVHMLRDFSVKVANQFENKVIHGNFKAFYKMTPLEFMCQIYEGSEREKNATVLDWHKAFKNGKCIDVDTVEEDIIDSNEFDETGALMIDEDPQEDSGDWGGFDDYMDSGNAPLLDIGIGGQGRGGSGDQDGGEGQGEDEDEHNVASSSRQGKKQGSIGQRMSSDLSYMVPSTSAATVPSLLSDKQPSRTTNAPSPSATLPTDAAAAWDNLGDLAKGFTDDNSRSPQQDRPSEANVEAAAHPPLEVLSQMFSALPDGPISQPSNAEVLCIFLLVDHKGKVLQIERRQESMTVVQQFNDICNRLKLNSQGLIRIDRLEGKSHYRVRTNSECMWSTIVATIHTDSFVKNWITECPPSLASISVDDFLKKLNDKTRQRFRNIFETNQEIRVGDSSLILKYFLELVLPVFLYQTPNPKVLLDIFRRFFRNYPYFDCEQYIDFVKIKNSSWKNETRKISRVVELQSVAVLKKTLKDKTLLAKWGIECGSGLKRAGGREAHDQVQGVQHEAGFKGQAGGVQDRQDQAGGHGQASGLQGQVGHQGQVGQQGQAGGLQGRQAQVGEQGQQRQFDQAGQHFQASGQQAQADVQGQADGRQGQGLQNMVSQIPATGVEYRLRDYLHNPPYYPGNQQIQNPNIQFLQYQNAQNQQNPNLQYRQFLQMKNPQYQLQRLNPQHQPQLQNLQHQQPQIQNPCLQRQPQLSTSNAQTIVGPGHLRAENCARFMPKHLNMNRLIIFDETMRFVRSVNFPPPYLVENTKDFIAHATALRRNVIMYMRHVRDQNTNTCTVFAQIYLGTKRTCAPTEEPEPPPHFGQIPLRTLIAVAGITNYNGLNQHSLQQMAKWIAAFIFDYYRCRDPTTGEINRALHRMFAPELIHALMKPGPTSAPTDIASGILPKALRTRQKELRSFFEKNVALLRNAQAKFDEQFVANMGHSAPPAFNLQAYRPYRGPMPNVVQGQGAYQVRPQVVPGQMLPSGMGFAQPGQVQQGGQGGQMGQVGVAGGVQGQVSQGKAFGGQDGAFGGHLGQAGAHGGVGHIGQIGAHGARVSQGGAHGAQVSQAGAHCSQFGQAEVHGGQVGQSGPYGGRFGSDGAHGGIQGPEMPDQTSRRPSVVSIHSESSTPSPSLTTPMALLQQMSGIGLSCRTGTPQDDLVQSSVLGPSTSTAFGAATSSAFGASTSLASGEPEVIIEDSVPSTSKSADSVAAGRAIITAGTPLNFDFNSRVEGEVVAQDDDDGELQIVEQDDVQQFEQGQGDEGGEGNEAMAFEGHRSEGGASGAYHDKRKNSKTQTAQEPSDLIMNDELRALQNMYCTETLIPSSVATEGASNSPPMATSPSVSMSRASTAPSATVTTSSAQSTSPLLQNLLTMPRKVVLRKPTNSTSPISTKLAYTSLISPIDRPSTLATRTTASPLTSTSDASPLSSEGYNMTAPLFSAAYTKLTSSLATHNKATSSPTTSHPKPTTSSPSANASTPDSTEKVFAKSQAMPEFYIIVDLALKFYGMYTMKKDENQPNFCKDVVLSHIKTRFTEHRKEAEEVIDEPIYLGSFMVVKEMNNKPKIFAVLVDMFGVSKGDDYYYRRFLNKYLKNMAKECVHAYKLFHKQKYLQYLAEHSLKIVLNSEYMATKRDFNPLREANNDSDDDIVFEGFYGESEATKAKRRRTVGPDDEYLDDNYENEALTSQRSSENHGRSYDEEDSLNDQGNLDLSTSREEESYENESEDEYHDEDDSDDDIEIIAEIVKRKCSDEQNEGTLGMTGGNDEMPDQGEALEGRFVGKNANFARKRVTNHSALDETVESEGHNEEETMDFEADDHGEDVDSEYVNQGEGMNSEYVNQGEDMDPEHHVQHHLLDSEFHGQDHCLDSEAKEAETVNDLVNPSEITASNVINQPTTSTSLTKPCTTTPGASNTTTSGVSTAPKRPEPADIEDDDDDIQVVAEVKRKLLSTNHIVIANEKLETIHACPFPYQVKFENIFGFTKEKCQIQDKDILEMYKIVVNEKNICSVEKVTGPLYAQVVYVIVYTGKVPQMPRVSQKKILEVMKTYDLAELIETDDKSFADSLRSGKKLKITDPSKAMVYCELVIKAFFQHCTFRRGHKLEIDQFVSNLLDKYPNLDKQSLLYDAANKKDLIKFNIELWELTTFNDQLDEVVHQYNGFLKTSPFSAETAKMTLTTTKVYEEKREPLIDYICQVQDASDENGLGYEVIDDDCEGAVDSGEAMNSGDATVNEEATGVQDGTELGVTEGSEAVTTSEVATVNEESENAMDSEAVEPKVTAKDSDGTSTSESATAKENDDFEDVTAEPMEVEDSEANTMPVEQESDATRCESEPATTTGCELEPTSTTRCGSEPAATVSCDSGDKSTARCESEVPLTSRCNSEAPSTSRFQVEVPLASRCNSEAPSTSRSEAEALLTSRCNSEVPSTSRVLQNRMRKAFRHGRYSKSIDACLDLNDHFLEKLKPKSSRASDDEEDEDQEELEEEDQEELDGGEDQEVPIVQEPGSTSNPPSTKQQSPKEIIYVDLGSDDEDDVEGAEGDAQASGGVEADLQASEDIELDEQASGGVEADLQSSEGIELDGQASESVEPEVQHSEGHDLNDVVISEAVNQQNQPSGVFDDMKTNPEAVAHETPAAEQNYEELLDSPDETMENTNNITIYDEEALLNSDDDDLILIDEYNGEDDLEGGNQSLEAILVVDQARQEATEVTVQGNAEVTVGKAAEVTMEGTVESMVVGGTMDSKKASEGDKDLDEHCEDAEKPVDEPEGHDNELHKPEEDREQAEKLVEGSEGHDTDIQKPDDGSEDTAGQELLMEVDTVGQSSNDSVASLQIDENAL